jgi:phenylalanyl-tRNA synthetase beta chain
MLFLKSWLNQYIDLQDISDGHIQTSISAHIAELDGIHKLNDWFDEKVVIGKIEKLKPHPNADRLKICEVNLGTEVVDIITAASNVIEGMILPIALEGARLPHITIQLKPMRGVLSYGMCLGKSELLQEATESAGLWNLSADFPERTFELGVSICPQLPELFPQDTIFDIDILPDKYAYLSSHISFAIELSTVFGNHRLKNLAKAVVEPELLNLDFFESPTYNSELIPFADEVEYAHTFTLWNVVSESAIITPLLWSQRLFLTQQNITFSPADISNYILKDLGQPTHFFSGDTTVKNWRITSSNPHETFEGLGQLKHTTLPAGTPLIKQDDEILAIPGISGGALTKAQSTEHRLNIEIATFDQDKIIKSSFKLGYRSDASKYYAAQVHKYTTVLVLITLAQTFNWKWTLKILHGFSSVTNMLNFSETPSLIIPWEYIQQRLDNQSSRDIIEKHLSKFGRIQENTFFPNPFYHVIDSKETMVHEVARQMGYTFTPDQLVDELRPSDTAQYQSHEDLKRILLEAGFDEIITRPFTEEKCNNKQLAIDPLLQNLELISTYRADRPYIRTHVIPHHLEVMAKSLLKGIAEPSFFELTRVYHKLQESHLEERLILGACLEGDVYRFTSILCTLSKQLGGNLLYDANQQTDSALGRVFNYHLPQAIAARIWEINKQTKKVCNIPLNKVIWCLEIVMPKIGFSLSTLPQLREQSLYPEIRRTFSLQTTLTWQEISGVIATTQMPNINIMTSPIEYFSEKKTYTFAAIFSPQLGTLEGQDIDQWSIEVLKHIQTLDIDALWR